MKTIYKSLIALAAALLLNPAAKAQYHQDATSGFAFDKYVTSKNPDENGEYTLRIETFATGAVTVEKKAIPSDIVLVLDASGSMKSNRMVHPTLRIKEGGASTNWSYSGVGAGLNTNTCIFVRYPDDETGTYYRVQHGHAKINGSTAYNDHWIFFVIPADEATSTPAQTKYIYGTYSATNTSNWIHDEKPTEGTYATEGATEYTGPLYRYPQRTEALKSAVKLFIDKIEQNDREDVQPYLEPDEHGRKTGNQISIVQYHGDSKSQNITTKTGDGNTKPLIDFTPVKDNVSTLKTAVNGLPASSNTPHDAGLKVAKLLLESLNADYPAFVGSTRQRLRTVVFFTDGQPAGGNGAYWIKKYALDLANEMKAHNADPTKNQEVKIFSIAFSPRKDAGEKNDKGFLEHVSSNYKGDCDIAQSSYALSGTDTGETMYYMDAGDPNMDMDSIFEFIAESVGGGGSSEYENTPLAAVDMVASSFELPENIDATRVKVYTAQCLGITGETVTDDKGGTHDELAFAEPVLAKGRGDVKYWNSVAVVDGDGNPVLDELGNPKYDWSEVTADIDENITINIDKTNKTVSVGGFDYEALWCGYDPEHDNQEYYTSSDPNYKYHQAGYRGFKIIIEFPIVVENGALGGPDVVTNLTSSGVYQTDEHGDRTGLPIVKYPIPSLPIPVNLWIEKRGLKPGESATFTILKKLSEPTETVPTPEYEFFTRINVIGAEDGSPVIAKLLNLDPIYYYKIWEEGWAWTYSNQAQDQDTAPSTETVTTNPIVITNKYEDPDPKHAEASKRNVMEKTTSSTTNP